MNIIKNYIIKLSVLAILLLSTGSFLFAQNPTPTDTSKKPTGAILKRDTVYENGKMIIYVTREEEKPVKQKKKKDENEKVEEPKEIEYKNNIYRTKSSWLNIGYGGSVYLRPVDFPYPNFGVGFNLPLAGNYLKLGANSSRIDMKSNYRNTFFMIGLGNRKHSYKRHYSYYLGVTYLAGHVALTDTANNQVKRVYGRTGGPGIFAEASAFYKPFYDVGLGLTAFANVDFRAPVVGIRLELYLSNAFKKKKPTH